MSGHAPDIRYSGIIQEYMTRRRLAKIGLTSPLDGMPARKVDQFMAIESAIDDYKAQQAKKMAAKRRR